MALAQDVGAGLVSAESAIAHYQKVIFGSSAVQVRDPIIETVREQHNPSFHLHGGFYEEVIHGDHGYVACNVCVCSEQPRLFNSGWKRASGQSPTLEKTRAQVREELFDAESAGLVPTGRTQYPPNEATIKRNQAHFGVVERYWESHR